MLLKHPNVSGTQFVEFWGLCVVLPQRNGSESISMPVSLKAGVQFEATWWRIFAEKTSEKICVGFIQLIWLSNWSCEATCRKEKQDFAFKHCVISAVSHFVTENSPLQVGRSWSQNPWSIFLCKEDTKFAYITDCLCWNKTLSRCILIFMRTQEQQRWTQCITPEKHRNLGCVLPLEWINIGPNYRCLPLRSNIYETIMTLRGTEYRFLASWQMRSI